MSKQRAELVLADYRVLSDLQSQKKNNTDFNIPQLVAGLARGGDANVHGVWAMSIRQTGGSPPYPRDKTANG